MCAAIPTPAVAQLATRMALGNRGEASARRASRRGDEQLTWPVVPGQTGDHAAIHQLLVAVFQGPSRDAFAASLDDPFYEPPDRLLIKRLGRVIAHAQITHRVMGLGELRLPVAGLQWLATLPEFRRQGCATRLLEGADRALRASGAVLGLLRTRHPYFFGARGWSLCGRHCQARAGTRRLLAQLSAQGLLTGDQPLSIRPWRQVELPGLMRLYDRSVAHAAGPLQRTEAYWRWLISRKNFDQVYVAIEGPDLMELELAGQAMVGYAVTREDRILELVADPAHPTAARSLLGRACSEAIEQDSNSITLDAPPEDPLWPLFQSAGGECRLHEQWQGEVFMVRVLDVLGFMRALAPELAQRAERAGLTRPCELGLEVDGQKHSITFSRRSARVSRQKLGRSYLRLNRAELARLALGHFSAEEALATGRVQASTRLAQEVAQALFPRLPYWRPPLDD